MAFAKILKLEEAGIVFPGKVIMGLEVMLRSSTREVPALPTLV